MKNTLAVLAVISLFTFTIPTLSNEISNLDLGPSAVVLANTNTSVSPTPTPTSITSPKVGDSYIMGKDSITIKWFPENAGVTTIQLVSSKGDTFQIYGQKVSGDPTNTSGSFVYKLPDTLSTIYPDIYYVNLIDTKGQNLKSRKFSIVSPVSSVPASNEGYSITGLTGHKKIYSSGSPIVFWVKGVEPDGSSASHEEGFNVQAHLSIDGANNALEAVNGTYNSSTGLWEIRLTAPKDKNLTYEVKASLYCGYVGFDSLCAQKYGTNSQEQKHFEFKVTNAVMESPASTPASVGYSQSGGGQTYNAQGCPKGAVFNFLTGAKCAAGQTLTYGCPTGAVYNFMTGEKCGSSGASIDRTDTVEVSPGSVRVPSVSSEPNNSSSLCYTFNRNLRVGDGGRNAGDGVGTGQATAIDHDVTALMRILSSEGLYDYYGFVQPGSAGSSIRNSYFSESLASAVVAFQEKYASEILKPHGLARGTGYVGPSTRAKLNQIYKCDGSQNAQKPFINILSPYSGQVFDMKGGKDGMVVKWLTQNISASTYLDLIRLRNVSTRIEYYLANNVMNDGQEVVSISPRIPSGLYTLEIKSGIKGYEDAVIGSSGKFEIISASAADTSTTVTPTTRVPVDVTSEAGSVRLVSADEDKAPKFVNGSRVYSNDWKWKISLANSGSTEKTIKRMILVHNTYGEGWATDESTDNPVAGNKALYLLAVTNDLCADCDPFSLYTNNLGRKIGPNSEISFYAYGANWMASQTFSGGYLLVEFTDGTSMRINVLASNIRPGSGSSTISTSPLSLITLFTAKRINDQKINLEWRTAELTNPMISVMIPCLSGSENISLISTEDKETIVKGCGKSVMINYENQNWNVLSLQADNFTVPITMSFTFHANTETKTVNHTFSPASTQPAISPGRTTINSGESVKLNLSFPSNTIRSSLYFYCPAGVVTGTSPEICNSFIDVTSNTDWTVMLSNSSSEVKKVVPNYYVYTSDSPNYAKGVSSEITVLPASIN